MGKNYTIYVSHGKFADESNKSGLINMLLKIHYMDKSDLVNGRAYAKGYKADMESRVIKTKEDARKAVEPLWRNKKKGIL